MHRTVNRASDTRPTSKSRMSLALRDLAPHLLVRDQGSGAPRWKTGARPARGAEPGLVRVDPRDHLRAAGPDVSDDEVNLDRRSGSHDGGRRRWPHAPGGFGMPGSGRTGRCESTRSRPRLMSPAGDNMFPRCRWRIH